MVNLRIVIKQVGNAVVAVRRERADEVELVPPARHEYLLAACGSVWLASEGGDGT